MAQPFLVYRGPNRGGDLFIGRAFPEQSLNIRLVNRERTVAELTVAGKPDGTNPFLTPFIVFVPLTLAVSLLGFTPLIMDCGEGPPAC
jgi:hypothetical protein